MRRHHALAATALFAIAPTSVAHAAAPSPRLEKAYQAAYDKVDHPGRNILKLGVARPGVNRPARADEIRRSLRVLARTASAPKGGGSVASPPCRRSPPASPAATRPRSTRPAPTAASTSSTCRRGRPWAARATPPPLPRPSRTAARASSCHVPVHRLGRSAAVEEAVPSGRPWRMGIIGFIIAGHHHRAPGTGTSSRAAEDRPPVDPRARVWSAPSSAARSRRMIGTGDVGELNVLGFIFAVIASVVVLSVAETHRARRRPDRGRLAR